MINQENCVQNGNETSQEAVVVMVPLPAQGHLNQLLHLSCLISAHNLHVYYVSSTTHIRQAKTRFHGLDPSTNTKIHFHNFQTPPFENPNPIPNTSIKFPTQIIPSLNSSIHLREPIHNFVTELSKKFRKVVVIYDSLMSYVVQDIDSVQNVEPYCFRSISACTIYSIHWKKLDRADLPNGAEVLKEFPSLDGLFPDEFAEFQKLQRFAKKVFIGDIYNSSREIEGLFLDLLEKEKTTGTEKIWALGPFNPLTMVPKPSDSTNRYKCLEWLDKQDPNSTIYVSFGTTSSFSDEQINEIAFGLERSEENFIWVLRDADKGDIFSGDVRKTILPDGFEERVKERGIILRDWAPQLEILRHGSTGGFMSHCGWNSCIESLSMGVPIATWPMHSDQPGNSFLVTKFLKIGVEVKDWARRDEVVSSIVVEKAVRRLMASVEGDEIRKRAAELGDSVKKSVMEGGSTHKEMESFITQITR